MAQLKSTNVTGNLSVTGDIIASTIKKFGGTSAQFLKADGSIDSNAYLTTSVAGRTYLTINAADENYQPLDENLTKIVALTGAGFLKRKSDNTWEIGTETTYTAGTGLTLNGTVFNHSNSVTAITTEGLYKIKHDAQGHITGTVAVVKADITNLGIPERDTGATSIEATGDGNAVTSASYDAETRKITLTKGANYQTLDADLTAIAGLTGTSGFLKKTAANTWSLDTNTYTKSPTSTTTSTFSLMGVDKTAHGNTAYYSDLTYVNSNTGQLTASSFGISTNATIKYESSDESIRFVFA